MSILLIGCTGFLGEVLIYKLLKETKNELVLAIRTKDEKSVNERINQLFDSIRLSYDEYNTRIKLVEVSYDKNSNIAISQENDNYIKNNVRFLINALADTKTNLTLRDATLNNTITAIQWMRKFQECKKGEIYLYISSAFVNFHRIKKGKIPEKIFEKGMSTKTLENILDGKQTTFGNYENSYLYSKQLSEILLNEERKNKHLVIIRPSIMIPAIQYPYPGWGKLQNMSLFIFGIGSGLLSMIQYNKDYYHNTVPVDIVAQDCLLTLNEKPENASVEIRHCCLTGNVTSWFSKESITTLRDRAYQYFVVNPLILKQKKLFPHKVQLKQNWWHIIITSIVHSLFMISHWWKWTDSWKDFIKVILKNLEFTYKFNKNFLKFSQKKIIFEREKREKNDIQYPTISLEDCYYEFVKKLQDQLTKDVKILNIFFKHLS